MTGYWRHRPPRKDRPRKPRLDYKESSVIILDYLPMGNPLDRYKEYRRKPVAQGIGTDSFALMELEPYPGLDFSVLEEVELGFESKIRKIVGRIDYEDLTATAKDNLPEALRRIVEAKEDLFVKFFNMSGPINIRLHSLELLPGVGKKTMKHILEERRKKPFESFEDIQLRIKTIDPVMAIVERLLVELQGQEKYYLFIKPPRTADKTSVRYLGYLEKLSIMPSKRY